MTATTFDTHKFIRRLRSAGFEEVQAEALVSAFNETNAARELAIKFDRKALEANLIKWAFGLLLTQAVVIAMLVKFL